MLTREEAKKCKCACLTIDKVHDVNMQILKEGGTKEELKQALTDWLESTRCIAENCPKWKDEFVKGYQCSLGNELVKCEEYKENTFEYEYCEDNGQRLGRKKITNESNYIKSCLSCDKHFGRCG